MIGWNNTERVTDRIGDSRVSQVQLNVPGLFARAFFVQPGAREESDRAGPIARRSRKGRGDGLGWRRGRRRRFGGCRRDGLRFGRCGDRAKFGIERLEHAGGFLATRDTEVQPLLAFAEDRVGVVLAVIAALATILLTHRRHHPPPQRPALRELHALGERHGGIMPGRFAVIAVGRWPARLRRDADRRDQRRAFGGAERIDAAVERQQPGEKAIQPGALLWGKWRSIGNQGRQRRRRGVGHSLACVSNKAFSASMSYRRVKAAKLSSRPARWAR